VCFDTFGEAKVHVLLTLCLDTVSDPFVKDAPKRMADEKVLAAPIDRIPFITQWKYVTRSSPHPTSPVDRFIEVYWEPPIREPRHATEEEEGAGILWFSAPQIAEAVGITPATRSSAMAAGYLRTFPRKYIAKLSTFPQPGHYLMHHNPLHSISRLLSLSLSLSL
jgi:hypothetical protein